MKKLFIALLLLGSAVASLESKAQNSAFALAVVDSVEDSGTSYVTYSGSSSYAYGTTAIEFTGTKVSGTVGGSCIVQVSISGTNWQTHPTADTLTLANQTTNYKVWPLASDAYKKYRVACTGTGTMVMAPSGAIYFKSTR